jgi:hypothetical protein
MSHAQDTEMYDKFMRVIIKMELALEKGLVIVLRKVNPLSLCVCEIYDRHSKVHVLRQDLMSCNSVGIVATPSFGVIKTRVLKKNVSARGCDLNYFANRLVYSEYPHRIWA